MNAKNAQPPVFTEPMSVEIVGDEIVLDGTPHVEIKLSAEAAIETGVRLVNAGIGIDDRSPALPPAGTGR